MMFQLCSILAWSLFTCQVVTAADPWRPYIFSPPTRNPSPKAVHSITGTASVDGKDGNYTLHMSANSRITMDFGVEVGGWVSFRVQTGSTTPLSLAFSESSLFARATSDDTGADPLMDWDQALNVLIKLNSSSGALYQTSKERFRGGFRYLTFNGLANATISNITCQVGFAPNMPDLQSGTGYFYTADPSYDILNRIWYAGAYTVQTNIAPTDTGRWLPQVRPGWAYNATLGVASPSLVDGAKRDRAIWPGDMGISGPAAMIAFGSEGREAHHNSLETLFYYQNSTTGLLPFAGPATGSFRNGAKSDTYHTWGLIGIYDYAMYSGDQAWLDNHWQNITRAVNYIVNGLDKTTGLQTIVNANDWGRRGTSGVNAGLNALAYHALVSMASLAKDATQAATWRTAAGKLKASFNSLLWDSSANLYKDNTTTTLHSQDGNSLAILFNLTNSQTRAVSVSKALQDLWNKIGPVSPELPNTISPFISGVELLGHLQVGEVDRAMNLTQRLWGFLLNDSTMTGSTFAEGITSNGSLYYRSQDGYKYDASYTSLSHSWSVAPTTALSTRIVGLSITGFGGKTWELKPALGKLLTARTGFETGLGKFVASLQAAANFTIELSAPTGTHGRILLPSTYQQITLNGAVVKYSATGIAVVGTGDSVKVEAYRR